MVFEPGKGKPYPYAIVGQTSVGAELVRARLMLEYMHAQAFTLQAILLADVGAEADGIKFIHGCEYG